jgi:hypothetical protein
MPGSAFSNINSYLVSGRVLQLEIILIGTCNSNASTKLQADRVSADRNYGKIHSLNAVPENNIHGPDSSLLRHHHPTIAW